jgi:hypothetical protein
VAGMLVRGFNELLGSKEYLLGANGRGSASFTPYTTQARPPEETAR